MNSSSREDVIGYLCERILQVRSPKLPRIGINGVDGSGKTMFTKDLVEQLRARTDRQIICATIDGFHNPRSVRYAKGRASAEGFYRDSFNNQGIVNCLLQPLSPGGDRNYKTQIFSVRTDSVVEQEVAHAQDDAILIVEGVFLFRKELLPNWDLKVFLDVPFEATIERMLIRDSDLFESESEERMLFAQRYMPGQKLYFDEAHPLDVADVVIDNTDFAQPKIIRS